MALGSTILNSDGASEKVDCSNGVGDDGGATPAIEPAPGATEGVECPDIQFDNGPRVGWWQRIRLPLGLAVSAGSLYLLFRNVDWDRLRVAIESADYFWLALSILTTVLCIWLKILRWQALLVPVGRVRQINLLHSTAVGILVNTVLPGRLGELARVYLLARLERLSVAAVLSTAIVDRVMDIVALSLMLAIVLPAANLPEWVTQSGIVIGAIGVMLLVICIALAAPRMRALVLRGVAALPKVAGEAALERRVVSLCLGLGALRGVGSLTRIGALSLLIWLVNSLTMYLGGLAFHFDLPVAAVLVTAVTSLGMAIPSSPGNIGVFHYLVVLVLTAKAFGVESETALVYAVIMHLTGLLPVSAFGAYSLWRCGLGLNSKSALWGGGGADARQSNAGSLPAA